MKRRPVQRSPSPSFKLDNEDDSYEPYVPVAQRRRQKLAKLYTEKQQDDLDDNEDVQKEEELRKQKARMERTLLMEAQEVHSKKAVEGTILCSWTLVIRLHPFFIRSQKNRKREG